MVEIKVRWDLTTKGQFIDVPTYRDDHWVLWHWGAFDRRRRATVQSEVRSPGPDIA